MENQPVIVERTFNAAGSLLWKAISDRDEMKKWYFDLEAFEPTPGFRFQFQGGPAPDRQYLHLCEVQEAVAPTKLSYSWRYDGYPGNSLVTFELSGQGDNTTLKLVHSGLETFDPSNADFAQNNFVEGWNHIINISLEQYIQARS